MWHVNNLQRGRRKGAGGKQCMYYRNLVVSSKFLSFKSLLDILFYVRIQLSNVSNEEQKHTDLVQMVKFSMVTL